MLQYLNNNWIAYIINKYYINGNIYYFTIFFHRCGAWFSNIKSEHSDY